MAAAVEQAAETGEHLLVQAGTGTGKSLAYLVPAIRHALDSGKPAVVATATIALQSQIIDRDLPRLAAAVAPVLGKDFVFTKIDVDRMIGGKELLAATRGPKESGIPWFAFLDGEGKLVASSTTEAGENLGCPWSPEEKAAFDKLLAAHATRITADERAAMLALLGERK